MQCLGDEHDATHLARETLQFMDSDRKDKGGKGRPSFVMFEMGQAHNRWPNSEQGDDPAFELISKLMGRKADSSPGGGDGEDDEDPGTVIMIVGDHGYVRGVGVCVCACVCVCVRVCACVCARACV